MTAPSARPQTDLDQVLNDLESTLARLGRATRSRDAASIEAHARHLHDLLGRMARAVDPSRRPAPPTSLTPRLRTRLMAAGRQIALQRTALARAAQPVDQAVAALTSPDPALVYVEGGRPAGLGAGIGSRHRP